jgi:hypothetical protein
MMNHSVKEVRKRKYKRWAMNVATYIGLWIAFSGFIYFFVVLPITRGW